MVVQYDGGYRGWIDSLLDADEFWVCDENSKKVVHSMSGKVRGFRSAELVFTGEWSSEVQAERTVELSPESLQRVLLAESWDAEMWQRTNVPVQIEHSGQAGAGGRVLVGPGHPPDVFRAVKLVRESVGILARNAAVESMAKSRIDATQSGQDRPRRYRVDNTVRKATSDGLAYRSSKDYAAVTPVGASWGSEVLGIDAGDGWLEVGDSFLPTHSAGVRVLVPIEDEIDEEERGQPSKDAPMQESMDAGASAAGGSASEPQQAQAAEDELDEDDAWGEWAGGTGGADGKGAGGAAGAAAMTATADDDGGGCGDDSWGNWVTGTKEVLAQATPKSAMPGNAAPAPPLSPPSAALLPGAPQTAPPPPPPGPTTVGPPPVGAKRRLCSPTPRRPLPAKVGALGTPGVGGPKFVSPTPQRKPELPVAAAGGEAPMDASMGESSATPEGKAAERDEVGVKVSAEPADDAGVPLAEQALSAAKDLAEGKGCGKGSPEGPSSPFGLGLEPTAAAKAAAAITSRRGGRQPLWARLERVQEEKAKEKLQEEAFKRGYEAALKEKAEREEREKKEAAEAAAAAEADKAAEAEKAAEAKNTAELEAVVSPAGEAAGGASIAVAGKGELNGDAKPSDDAPGDSQPSPPATAEDKGSPDALPAAPPLNEGGDDGKLLGAVTSAGRPDAGVPSQELGQPAGAAQPGDEGEEGKMTVQYWMEHQDQFAHLSRLPDNWIRVLSSGSRIYFVNVVTGKTQGYEPDELPPGWVKQVSRSTGKMYYWHVASGRAQFERPSF